MRQRQTIVWTILLIECVVIILTFFIMPFVLPVDPVSYFLMPLLLVLILLQGWLHFPLLWPGIKMGKLLYTIPDKTTYRYYLAGIDLLIAISSLIKFLNSRDQHLSDFLIMITWFLGSLVLISFALLRIEIRENGFMGYGGFFKWDNIVSYEWAGTENLTLILTLKKCRINKNPNFLIPQKDKVTVNQILQERVLARQEEPANN